MTAPDIDRDLEEQRRAEWCACCAESLNARDAAQARLRGLHAVLWLALAGITAIAALCGTLAGAEAASHAVARHNVNRQETNR
jgi:hypothetical protein